MRQGNFFFVSDDFFVKHDPGGHLMKNKGNSNNRPCYYAFPDKKEPSIFWCVPISSRIEKFERIAQKKIASQLQRRCKKPTCNTIRFGEVLGQKRAFLIQNMFPVTAAYITSTYIDRNTQKPVTIAPFIEKDIYVNAKDILKLVSRGHNNLVFSDILKIYSNLAAELHLERQRNTEMALEQTGTAPARASMKDRFATAQAEAARRNSLHAPAQPQHSPDKSTPGR